MTGQHVQVRPRLLSALVAAFLLSACAQQQARLSTAPAAPVPPDLAGRPLTTHADRVLVAGDATTLSTSTGTFRITVMGPATRQLPSFRALPVGQLHDYLATFTVRVEHVSGSARLSPADFRLLAIADQVDGGAVRTTVATVTTLVPKTLTTGSWAGTWTAPFTEGHGELLFTPAGGRRPAALWDFRVES